MTMITLLPLAEKVAPDGIVPGYRGIFPLLYHQVRTYEALQHMPLVMNTYPTGTGKTIAALLHLLNPGYQQGNTLLIAPTNALIDQHAQDANTFIEQNHLSMRVIIANAAKLHDLAPELRAGERTELLMRNPLNFAERLGLPDDAQKQPFVMVTNPDIFYLALYFQYRRVDQRTMFSAMISRFQYVIIDEFHSYDSKQFANFLFFFQLWKKWAFFDHAQNRVCLLSATPHGQVYTYLHRVFGQESWTRIGPDNEPPESALLETTPTLTELRMHVVTGQIEEWVHEHKDDIASWQHQGLDSAIISSSLGRINTIYANLRSLDPVRITGPEPAAERQRVRPLVLATPTVDIGYNFGRPGKQRQSIDRLVCDARFGDEVTQRIGRVGRVLGRKETTIPSEAVVVVSDDAAEELRSYDGQYLSRSAWATIVNDLTNLPPKHQFDGYIAVHALRESFYPIFQIQKLSSSDMQEQIEEELFGMIREVFAPHTSMRKWQLRKDYESYERRQRWLSKPESKRWVLDDTWNVKDLSQHVADYLSWQESLKGKEVCYRGDQVQLPLLHKLLSDAQKQQYLITFLQSRVALTKALLNFREAWQGPAIAVYDPEHLLSSEEINYYDALHLVSNYDLHIFQHRKEFEQVCGQTGDYPCYVKLKKFRVPKLVLGFDYTCPSEWTRQDFEERYCRQVVTLQGFRLVGYERGSQKEIMLDSRICTLVEEDWIPCLIVEQEYSGRMISKLRVSPWYARELRVLFPQGLSHTYRIVTGTAAFHVFATLFRYFNMLNKQLSEDWFIL